MSALPVLFAVAVLAGLRGTWSPCGLSMVSAINPFSERSRGYRYPVTAAWFVLGAAAGGIVLGGATALLALLVRLAGLPAGAAASCAVAACLAAAASDARTFGVALPDHPRQVNERWLEEYRRWVYAAGFGAQIGVGFATYIMTAGVYLLVALGGLGASPAAALAAGALFGTVRGLAVLLTARTSTPAALRDLHRRLAAAAPWSARCLVAAQAAAGLALAAGTSRWLLLAAAVAVGAGAAVQLARASAFARARSRFSTNWVAFLSSSPMK